MSGFNLAPPKGLGKIRRDGKEMKSERKARLKASHRAKVKHTATIREWLLLRGSPEEDVTRAKAAFFFRYHWLGLRSRSPGGEGVACNLRPFGIQVVVSMLKWSLLMSRTKFRKFWSKLRKE